MDTYTELIVTKQSLLQSARGDKDNPSNLRRRIDENTWAIAKILRESQQAVKELTAESEDLTHRLANLPEIIADLMDEVSALQAKKKLESPAAKELARLIAQYTKEVENE